MNPIDKSEYEERLKRMNGILSEIVEHAQVQAYERCPYRDAQDRCTAKFGCRHQRRSDQSDLGLLCSHNGTFDYRTAWESNPAEVAVMRESLRTAKGQPPIAAEDSAPAKSYTRFGDLECVTHIGKSIFDHADLLQAPVPTSCGRTGYCHECIVQVRQGEDLLSAPTEAEAFLGDGYRLACQAIVETAEQDIDFALLRRSPQILTARQERDVEPDPLVTREGDQVLYDGEVIDQYRSNLYGLSIDLGSTTVVAELVDLETGVSKYTTSFENPQRFGGSDILNRISYDAGEFHGELHRAMINTLNSEIRAMCAQTGASRHEIYEIVIVGNSTMRDLFFDLDVQPIGVRPYKSTTELACLDGKRESTSLLESARKLRLLVNKNARVFGAPLIASHVGADTAAALMTLPHDTDEMMLLVDIGTNTEVVIGNRDRLIAASCPAGPAFEGGLVKFGMPGCEGAIESLQYVDGEFTFKTIGGKTPVGICGSGLVDLLAELRRHQLMTPKGVFSDKLFELNLLPIHGITFSRQDASHLAQAKAANYCGQLILMRALGLGPDKIGRLYLAGGFANYIDPAAAIEIGFLAPIPTERVVKIGNAASQGARELLLSSRQRQDLEALVKSVEHIELETTPDFFEVFVEGCQFKPMLVDELN